MTSALSFDRTKLARWRYVRLQRNWSLTALATDLTPTEFCGKLGEDAWKAARDWGKREMVWITGFELWEC